MKLILIHGQGRTPLAMRLLGWRLKRRGHEVYYFGYISFIERFIGIVDRFVRMIQQTVGAEPYTIVSHSLGGLIARAALPHLQKNLPQHLIMLAPPNQPSRMAKRAQRHSLYAWVAGECGQKLADNAFYKSLPRPTILTTIIAGVGGPQGKLSPLGLEENDWVLSVAETRLGQGERLLTVNAAHALIMHSREVARLILDSLAAEAT